MITKLLLRLDHILWKWSALRTASRLRGVARRMQQLGYRDVARRLEIHGVANHFEKWARAQTFKDE